MVKGRRIQELEKALKKRKDDERAYEKTAEASCNKLKKLAEVNRGKINEASSFNAATVEIMGRYHECLCSVGPIQSFRLIAMPRPSWNGCAAKSLPWKVT